jgi:hypothetical protein
MLSDALGQCSLAGVEDLVELPLLGARGGTSVTVVSPGLPHLEWVRYNRLEEEAR